MGWPSIRRLRLVHQWHQTILVVDATLPVGGTGLYRRTNLYRRPNQSPRSLWVNTRVGKRQAQKKRLNIKRLIAIHGGRGRNRTADTGIFNRLIGETDGVRPRWDWLCIRAARHLPAPGGTERHVCRNPNVTQKRIGIATVERSSSRGRNMWGGERGLDLALLATDVGGHRCIDEARGSPFWLNTRGWVTERERRQLERWPEMLLERYCWGRLDDLFAMPSILILALLQGLKRDGYAITIDDHWHPLFLDDMPTATTGPIRSGSALFRWMRPRAS